MPELLRTDDPGLCGGIVLYVLTLPIGLVFSLGYYAIPVVVFIFYVLCSLELIAEEIEDPFGKDANDLPMQGMCENIRRNVEEILLEPVAEKKVGETS